MTQDLPFKINDRVRERTHHPKVGCLGTVIEVDGASVIVSWDNPQFAPTRGAADSFRMVEGA
jgi:hypothetical protein